MSKRKPVAREVHRKRVFATAAAFALLAVVTTSIAIFMIRGVVRFYGAQLEANRPPETVLVVAAAGTLYEGIIIGVGDLYALEVPRSQVPEGAVLSPDEIIGRIPRERILEDEWIRLERLATPDAGMGLSAVIPRGMRGVSINIGHAAALAGFLEPGSYVDLLVTMEEEDRGVPGVVPGRVTRTLMQAALVLAVNSRFEQGDTVEPTSQRAPRSSVTLLVTADQSVQLAQSAAVGQITLTLRQDTDPDIAALSGASIDDLRRKLMTPAKTARPARVARADRKLCHQFAMIAGDHKEVRFVDDAGISCE